MKIDKISFKITAFLGKTTLTLAEYADLQIGDILVLDAPIEKGIVVYIGQQAGYRARVGLFEMYKAISIDGSVHS